MFSYLCKMKLFYSREGKRQQLILQIAVWVTVEMVVQFKFLLWRLVSVQLSQDLIEKTDSFQKKQMSKPQKFSMGDVAFPCLILKSETFLSYRYITLPLQKPSKQFRLQIHLYPEALLDSDGAQTIIPQTICFKNKDGISNLCSILTS